MKREVDRLCDWVEGPTLYFPELTVTFRLNDQRAEKHLLAALPKCWLEPRQQQAEQICQFSFLCGGLERSRSIRPYHHIYREEERLGRSVKLGTLLSRLVVEIHEQIAAHSSLLFLHGRVWWSGDSCWGLVGPHSSEAMKAECWQLHSQPYIVLEQKTLALAYPEFQDGMTLTGLLLPANAPTTRLTFEESEAKIPPYLLRDELQPELILALKEFPVWTGRSVPE